MAKHLREFFGFPDILGTIAVWAALLAVAMQEAGRPLTWLALATGAVLFFWSEYLTHRFLFHMAPPKSPFLRCLIHRLHYDHHESPNDLHLLFLPMWYSIPQLILFGVAAWWVTGALTAGAAFALGSVTLLLYYEWTHFVAHRPIIPLTPWGRWMKKYHLWHHFKNEHYWFGVTNPSLDMVLGTYRDVGGVEKSATARKLDADLSD